MFSGVNELNLDAKGRMSLPSRYHASVQDACGGILVVTIDMDKNLLIYPLPEWQRIQEKLMDLPSFDKQARRIQRLLVGHATECKLDNQNRILLPPLLREFANITKQAVLIGQGYRFELWNKNLWDQNCEEWIQLASESGEIADALESLSI